MAPARICSRSGSGNEALPLPRKPRLIGKALGGFQHAMNIPWAGRAGCGVGSGGRAGAAADQRGQARRESGPDKLRANKMDVRIDAARGDDFSFAGDRFRARADDHSGSDAAHDVGIAGLADSHDASAADSDVGLDDSPVVHDHRVGDHHIESAVLRSGRGGLAHAVAQHFAAAEFGFVAGRGEVRSISMRSRCRPAERGRRWWVRKGLAYCLRGISRLICLDTSQNP